MSGDERGAYAGAIKYCVPRPLSFIPVSRRKDSVDFKKILRDLIIASGRESQTQAENPRGQK